MPAQYAANFDIREELNAGAVEGDKNYKGEAQLHEALITRSAKHATRVIDGKLESVYPDQVPWAASGDVPTLVRSVAEDLSVYYVRRAKHPGPGPMSDDVKGEYYDKPMAILEQIADREILLNELSIGYPDVYHSRKNRDPIFDMDDVIDQEVDPELLDDISNAKDD